MCKYCSEHIEAYRSFHQAMTNRGFDGNKDLRPPMQKKKPEKLNPIEGDNVDTSALDMAEIARMLAEARKPAQS